jgi:hypothetical protein
LGAALIVLTGTTNRSPSTEASHPLPNCCARERAEWSSTSSVINTRLIHAHWDDLLRLAGSLHRGTVRASQIGLPVVTEQERTLSPSVVAGS